MTEPAEQSSRCGHAEIGTHQADGRSPVCIFAKAAVAGTVKTRLATSIGAVAAAELARAFLLDTWRTVSTLSWASPVLATTDVAAHGDLDTALRWQQGTGSLGDRLERIFRRALEDSPTAIALGADSPGLPGRHVDAAHALLDDTDAVIGPCFDGGFYLLGLHRCPVGLLDGVPWSTAEAFEATYDRLRAQRLEVVVLDPWFDVDRAADLDLLRLLLHRGALEAPATAEALGRLYAPGMRCFGEPCA